MLKPTYRIRIGSETFEGGPRSPVLSVKVNLDMDIPADSFEIRLSEGTNSSRISDGDDVSIQLGYDESLVDVIGGLVDNVEPGIAELRVSGLDYSAKLLELRVDQLYENQSAGAIISDLARQVGVNTGDVSNGLRLAMYVVDSNNHAFGHVYELAEKCGFDVYMTNERGLMFKEYARTQPHILEYGKNILHATLQEEKPVLTSVVVQGESPSSFKGADTSHWLTKRSVEGVVGRGPRLLIQDPTVRDKDTAEKVARARMNTITRVVSGTIKIVGNAEIKLGDTIEIRDMKNAKMNGEFQVRSVEHYLSKNEGFTTSIGWRK
jgi:phage protein D